MSRTKKTCGHFRTCWCKVYKVEPDSSWSVRYCKDCSVAVEHRRGTSIADYAHKAERAAARKAKP